MDTRAGIEASTIGQKLSVSNEKISFKDSGTSYFGQEF